MKRFVVEIQEFDGTGEVRCETEIAEGSNHKAIYDNHLYLLGRKYAFKRKGYFKLKVTELTDSVESFDGHPMCTRNESDAMILKLARDHEKEYRERIKNFKIEGP